MVYFHHLLYFICHLYILHHETTGERHQITVSTNHNQRLPVSGQPFCFHALTLPSHQGEGRERAGSVDKKFALGFAQSISWKHSCNLEACALLPDEKVPKAD